MSKYERVEYEKVHLNEIWKVEPFEQFEIL